MQTTKNDELNIIDYFSEMSLSQKEIDKRIAFAQSIKELYHRAFVMIKAQKAVSEINDDTFDYIFFEEYLLRGYNSAAEEQGIDISQKYISDYFAFVIQETLTTTVKHINDNKYLSDSRAIQIAVNDSNSICNYLLDAEMQAKGFTYKRWVTMRDTLVRHTHEEADGQQVPIMRPFIVGTSNLMFPCDISLMADASEVINCRCTCQYLR